MYIVAEVPILRSAQGIGIVQTVNKKQTKKENLLSALPTFAMSAACAIMIT